MKAFFRQRGYKAETPQFHPIKEKSKKVFFIDGGNALIHDEGIYAKQLIRAAVVCFEGEQRTTIKQEEGICETRITVQDMQENYINTLRGGWQIASIIDAYDKKLAPGSRRIDISVMGEVMRRFAELQEAITQAQQHNDSIIVLDGTLECTLPDELDYLDELYTVARKNNNIVVGFNKTNRTLTEENELFTETLKREGPDGLWYAYPIVTTDSENYQATMCFAKLHKHAEHIFHIDVYGNVAEAISALIATSKDFLFPGYPYGLILADRIARVSEYEKRQKLQEQELLNKQEGRTAINAHQILDRSVKYN